MKIFLDSIGCRLNLSEIEKLAAQFAVQGHTLVARVQEAELVVVNTCAVTGKAVSDSRKAVRKAAEDPGVRVIATGCWATLEPEEVSHIAKTVAVVDNRFKEKIAEQILGGEVDEKQIPRKPLPGQKFRTRAFIKVQEGCDQHCTFCVTRIARGKSISKSEEEVLNDIRWAISGGAQEVVLTGVNLGAWGKERYPPQRLTVLIQAILQYTTIPRLRLSSLEPWDLEPGFFSLWENTRLCPQLHLPLQSGSDEILKKMGRKTTRHDFSSLIAAARQVIPDVAISTDMIVGFPGERKSYFDETMAFLAGLNLASGHVFAFSPRKGTAAARMTPRVAPADIKQRSREMRLLFDRSGWAYREQFVGRVVEVLWESSMQIGETWQLSGLSEQGLRVRALSDCDRWNQIDTVRLIQWEKSELTGEII